MSSQEQTARAETPEEIEARLAAQRADLAASVDALAGRISPTTQVREAVEGAKASARGLGQSLRERGADLQARARQAVSEAREGDPEAVKTLAVAGGALVTAATVGLAIVRRSTR